MSDKNTCERSRRTVGQNAGVESVFPPDVKIAMAQRLGADCLSGSDSPMLDAKVLLKAATGFSDSDLIVAANDGLSSQQAHAFKAMIARRAEGEPVAYITGQKEFWSLSFAVTPGVLTPRPDSESLIEMAIERRPRDSAMHILDLGTGSGCLLCALLFEFRNAIGVGIDKSELAARLARSNALGLGMEARTQFVVGNWGDTLSGPFDLIIANPPYIPDHQRNSLASTVRDYEPNEALFAGLDGFDAYRAILARAPELLSHDGLVIFEAGHGQAGQLLEVAAETFPSAGLFSRKDLSDRRRAVAIDCSFMKKRH